MATITNEQIKKINDKCKNGWELDVEYFVFYNKKQLQNRIVLDQNNYLEFTLRYDWQNQIILHIINFYHEPDKNYAISEGFGKRTTIANNTGKKAVKNLIDQTPNLSKDVLLELDKNTK